MGKGKVIPGYRRHSSGQARVTLNGRDYLLGDYDSPESKEAYARLIAEYLGNSAPIENGYTDLMSHVVLAYLDFAEGYYPTGNEYANMRLAVTPVVTLYAELPADQFGPAHFKAIRAHWLQQGHSRQYVNKLANKLLRFLRWAAGEGKMPAQTHQACRCVEPLKKGRCDAKEAAPVESVSLWLVARTLRHAGPILAAMIRFQIRTACRPGEVCRITPAMVDRSSDVWEIHLAEHKTAHRDRRRVLYVGPKGQKILAPYLVNREPDQPCFSPAEAEAIRRGELTARRVTPASCGNRPGTNRKRTPGRKPGNRYTTDSYGKAVRNLCKRFGLPSWSPNQLRHTRATELRRRFDLEAASVILGHAELDVTQVYAEKDRQKAIEITRKIG